MTGEELSETAVTFPVKTASEFVNASTGALGSTHEQACTGAGAANRTLTSVKPIDNRIRSVVFIRSAPLLRIVLRLLCSQNFANTKLQ
jgi:hypothetical protein